MILLQFRSLELPFRKLDVKEKGSTKVERNITQQNSGGITLGRVVSDRTLTSASIFIRPWRVKSYRAPTRKKGSVREPLRTGLLDTKAQYLLPLLFLNVKTHTHNYEFLISEYFYIKAI